MHRPVRAALPQEVAEVLPEEHGRPPVREDEAGPFYVRREIMGRDLFEKWCHTVISGLNPFVISSEVEKRST
jgi:hypothetical protein